MEDLLEIIDCIEEIRNRSDFTSEAEIVSVSNISEPSDACTSLRDLKMSFVNLGNFEVASNVSRLLFHCKSDLCKSKLKNKKQKLISVFSTQELIR